MILLLRQYKPKIQHKRQNTYAEKHSCCLTHCLLATPLVGHPHSLVVNQTHVLCSVHRWVAQNALHHVILMH